LTEDVRQVASPLTPKLPFLLPALIAWIEDNSCTPMLVSQVDVPGVSIPEGYAKDGIITFNVSSRAVQGFVVDAEAVCFGARFGGRHFDVRLPLASLRAIFAREHPKDSGVSLIGEARECAKASVADEQAEPVRKKGPPKLRLVD